MITLVVIKSDIRGMNYGMGTYVTQLTSSLSMIPELQIFHLNYCSTKFKELTIIRLKNRVVDIYIPLPKVFKNDDKHIARHSARVVDLLLLILSNEKNVVFQVNYPSVFPLVREIKQRLSFPVISVIHSASWQFLSIGNKNKFIEVWTNREDYEISALKELLEEKELYESVDKIVSVTSYMKDFVHDFYEIEESKITIIPNGLDSSVIRIPDDSEKYTIKKQLGFEANEKILIFSGRLDKGKGLHFLLQAFNEVFRLDKNVSLVIMGEDSGMERISDFLQYCKDSWSKVVFTGFLKYEAVIRFYKVADVGVIPSIFDHCPYTAIEMMAFNIPLILSNTEGLNEMLNENQAVYIQPVYDIDGNISFDINELVNAIMLLINDENKIKEVTKDYPELMNNKFSIKRMADEMFDVLKNLSVSEENRSELTIN